MKTFLFIVLILALLAGVFYYLNEEAAEFPEFAYTCAGNGDLTVRVQEGSVAIHSDSGTIVREKLDKVPAASGAKYENKDFVFWSQGTEATVWEDGKVILADCEVR